MLISYLERGNIFRGLSKSQMFLFETAFLLYLVKAISFREALDKCNSILDDDQDWISPLLKIRMSEMIGDADCNLIFKPAILRLIAGDDSQFRSLGASTKRTKIIIENYRRPLRRRLQAIVFPIEEIGPKHIASLEMKHLKLVESHARRYVNKHAHFLTRGDSGTTIMDITRDLLITALKSMRAYYPFRDGLYLTNTMRNTITNRGRGIITYSTAGIRQRLYTDEKGIMVNRESSNNYEEATNWVGWSENPLGNHMLHYEVGRLTSNKGVEGRIARFMLDPVEQDDFCTWLESKIPACADSDDVASAVAKSGMSYSYLLSRFLNVSREDVDAALTLVRAAAA